MYKYIISKVCVMLALGCTAFSAQASSNFSFDFNVGNGTFEDPAPNSFGNHRSDWSYINGYPYASTFVFIDEDLTVRVQAGVSNPQDNDNNPTRNGVFLGGDDGVYVGQFPGGLGVGFEINPRDIDDDYHTVDDSRGNDFLQLNFNQTVWLQGLDFAYFDWGADFQLFRDSVDGELLYDSGNDGIRGGIGGIDLGRTGIVTFADMGFEGSTFVVQAGKIGERDHEADYFKLEGAFGHVTPIPAPTAVLTGLAMLGVMSYNRRRKIVY